MLSDRASGRFCRSRVVPRVAAGPIPSTSPTSAEQILDDFRKYIAQMQPKLPELFGFIPGSPVTVEAMPDFQAAIATHYQTGTPDGKRPGRVVVAMSNFADRSLIDDEATAYHEGIPGHHMQLSVAQQMTGLPKFRQHGQQLRIHRGLGAVRRAARQGSGLLPGPGQRLWPALAASCFARCAWSSIPAHSKGWTRDQVVDFFRQSGAVDEPTIQAETDRYIAWPAQALAYKLGQLKFRELARARAEGAGPEIRHPRLPRRDAERRRAAARSAGLPHG